MITFFALHFGSYGGNPIRWVYFFLGLSGAFLFYTGNLLWVESRRRRQRSPDEHSQQARNTRLIAAATVGVCWGYIAGISAAMATGKWLHTQVSNPNDWYMWVYYAVFLASVCWAFLRGAGRASIELLWLCCISTLAIPVTGLISWLIPETPVWLHTAPDLLLVEMTALVAGVIFAFMAIKLAIGYPLQPGIAYGEKPDISNALLN